MVEGSPRKRIVVVSPHLDDAVLSLGAAIASWAGEGARVEVLTVLGCDPDSDAPAGGWDRRGGFATEGEAARVRREEDARACEILGATPVWLPFGDVDYERHGDEAAVRAAVLAAVADADELLVPGFPLTHPDHVWVAQALEGVGKRVGRYAEQPYARRSGENLPAGFAQLDSGFRARIAKWRAIRRYRSQLHLLDLKSWRRGPRTLLRSEHVSWVR